MEARLLKRSSASRQGDLSEAELLNLVRSCDASGMRAFYERYVGFLTAVCSRYVPDRAAVKDILQEVFVKAFDRIGSFEYRGEGSVKAWMHRIVVNDSLKFLRANGKMKYVDDLPDVEDEQMDSLPDVPVSVVAEMIKSLPDGYRTVFNLFVFEKKSHREIAELLGIKEDSSASQFFRARAMLAKKIKEYVKKNE